jgi:chitodextrinase
VDGKNMKKNERKNIKVHTNKKFISVRNLIVVSITLCLLSSLGTSLHVQGDVTSKPLHPSQTPHKAPAGDRGISWDVRMNFTETGGRTEYVYFGEAPDAHDGPPADSYDTVKPPAPMPPYLRAWLNDNLPTPYDVLWKDYRSYPDTMKVWNLSVQWIPSDYVSPTMVTLSWDTILVDSSEYTNVTLHTDGGTPLKNMLLFTNYTFFCPANIPQNFKIICSSNHPPNAPATPTGPTARIVGQYGKYFGSTIDVDGDQVQYRFDWNASGSHLYSAWSVLVNSGVSVNRTHTWGSSGIFVVRVQARDEHGIVGNWSNGLTVTVHHPPNTPVAPTGPTVRIVGQYGKYFASTTDLDGDQVQYRFDWNASGSHLYSAWSVLVNSGVSVNRTHRWVSSGVFVVKVQARDQHGGVGGWSNGLTVTVQVNQPPSQPVPPTGPTSRVTGQSGKYFGSTIDLDGDQVQYRFDWNASGSHQYSTWTVLVNSGISVNKTHSWSVPGTYVVKVQARDEHGVVSTWSNGLTVTVQVNHPPDTPVAPTGPTARIVGQYGKYFGSTIDVDGDQVQYRFDWNASGSHLYSAWTILVNSGESMNKTHSWSSPGVYVVKVQARDEHGGMSAWSDGLPVIVN